MSTAIQNLPTPLNPLLSTLKMLQNWATLSKQKKTKNKQTKTFWKLPSAVITTSIHGQWWSWSILVKHFFYVIVNIFGNGAAYCTLIDSTMVTFLFVADQQPCVHWLRKREAVNKNLPAHVGRRTSMQSDDLLLSCHTYCREWSVRGFSFSKKRIIHWCTTCSYYGYFNQWLHAPVPKLPFSQHWHIICTDITLFKLRTPHLWTLASLW